jgi:hypothetical protein
MTERDLERQALDIPCPECTAKPYKRCRALNKKRYKGSTLRRPHSERVAIVWREWLKQEAGVDR